MGPWSHNNVIYIGLFARTVFEMPVDRARQVCEQVCNCGLTKKIPELRTLAPALAV